MNRNDSDSSKNQDCAAEDSKPDESDARYRNQGFELYQASNQLILDEIRDQHNETLNSINSLIQRSGIIMAFNSVFMIELFRLQHVGGIIWWITIACTLSSMFLGLGSIITGRLAPLGTDINSIVNTYNKGTYEDLAPTIFNGKSIALKKTTLIAQDISNLILIQTLFLIASVIGLIIMEV